MREVPVSIGFDVNTETLAATKTSTHSPQVAAKPRDAAPDACQSQRRARVLLLIKGLGLGGAEKLFSMAAPHLDRQRFEYEVGYFLPWKDALVGELESHGLPVTCFDIRRPWVAAGIFEVAAIICSDGNSTSCTCTCRFPAFWDEWPESVPACPP